METGKTVPAWAALCALFCDALSYPARPKIKGLYSLPGYRHTLRVTIKPPATAEQYTLTTQSIAEKTPGLRSVMAGIEEGKEEGSENDGANISPGARL
jgi:hypothetical protein